MASNRTMDMALGKLGKKPMMSDPQDGEPSPGSEDSGDETETADEEDPDEKKTAFVDMCKAIKSGDYDKAYELYQDICDGM